MTTETQAPIKTNSLLGSRYRYRNVVYYAVLIFWTVLTLFIFAWLILSSTKTNVEVFGKPWDLPGTPVASAIINYTKAWTVSHMSTYFLNSVLVTIASVALVIAFSAPASYALSRVRFPGRTFVTYYFIVGMGLPLQLIMIPLFVMLANFHLVNTRAGLILAYVGVSIPFTILLLTGFFRTLPTELEEAAAIDGCSEFAIFWRVMLPLAGPGLFTAAIFNFISIWNEYLLAMLLINKDKIRTMPIGVMALRTSMQYTADWSGLFAAVVIVIIPALILYLLLSERVMSGLTLGSSK